MADGSDDLKTRLEELTAEVGRLRSADEFLRSIVESAPDFIVRIRPDGTVLYINRVAPGFRPEDLVGHSVFEFIPRESQQAARDCYARVIASGRPDYYEAHGFGANNEPTIFFVRVGPVLHGGEVTSLTLILTDILPMKRAERELRESEAKVRLTVAASGMGLWYWDLATGSVSLDETLLQIVGESNRRVQRSWDLFERVHSEDRERVRDVFSETVTSAAPLALEYRYVRPDGALRWLSTRATAVRDDRGQTISLVGGTLDVTDRRVMDEKLRQMQKLEALGQLTAGVAHNFNNMLGAILPAIDLARTGHRDSAALLGAAHDAGRRAADLVRQLMLFVGGRPRQAGPTKVSEVVERTVGICRTTFDRRIDIALDIEPNLPSVEVDPAQLEQAVLNILINARDALAGAESAPRIGVYVDLVPPDAAELRRCVGARPVEHVRVRITDNGCGMGETVRQRVFEPFFTTKDVGQGTGLGLSSSFGIVRDAHGFIDCESSAGLGTTFTILFPRTERNEARRSDAPVSSGGNGTESLLVVDDETAVREVVANVLRHAGYLVATARDGRDGFEQLCAPGAHFDAIILDDSMPHLSGTALLREILARNPKAKVIGFTGDGEDLAGARATLAKPAAASALLRVVRAVLDAD